MKSMRTQEIIQQYPRLTETEASTALSRLLDDAAKNTAPSVITRNGEVAGAVIGETALQQFLAWRAHDAALRTKGAMLPTGIHSAFDEAQTGQPITFTRAAVRTLLTECSPGQIAAVLDVLPELDYDPMRGELLSLDPEVRRTLAWSDGGARLWLLHWVRDGRVFVDVSREGVE